MTDPLDLDAIRRRHARRAQLGAVLGTSDAHDDLAALLARVEQLAGALERLIVALDDCEGNRGRFSCVEEHDGRCPKSRSPQGPEGWRGDWKCECGSEELAAVTIAARALLGAPREGPGEER